MFRRHLLLNDLFDGGDKFIIGHERILCNSLRHIGQRPGPLKSFEGLLCGELYLP